MGNQLNKLPQTQKCSNQLLLLSSSLLPPPSASARKSPTPLPNVTMKPEPLSPVALTMLPFSHRSLPHNSTTQATLTSVPTASGTQQTQSFSTWQTGPTTRQGLCTTGQTPPILRAPLPRDGRWSVSAIGSTEIATTITPTLFPTLHTQHSALEKLTASPLGTTAGMISMTS